MSDSRIRQPAYRKQAATGIEVDLVRQLLPDYTVAFIQMPCSEMRTAGPQVWADVAVSVRPFSDGGVFRRIETRRIPRAEVVAG